jgi:hypothetical protein
VTVMASQWQVERIKVSVDDMLSSVVQGVYVLRSVEVHERRRVVVLVE